MKWLLQSVIFLVVVGSCSAQTTDLNFIAGLGGLRPLHPDVVRLSADDNGPTFISPVLEGQFELQRKINLNFRYGLRLGFQYAYGEFELPCKCAHTQDRVVIITNYVNLSSIDMVVFMKYRSNKERYIYGHLGLGMSRPVFGERKVSYEVRYVDNRPDEVTDLINEDYMLTTRNGSRWMPIIDFGAGYNFSRNRKIQVEVFAKVDLGRWDYSLTLNPGAQEIDFQRTVFGIRGIFHLASF